MLPCFSRGTLLHAHAFVLARGNSALKANTAFVSLAKLQKKSSLVMQMPYASLGA